MLLYCKRSDNPMQCTEWIFCYLECHKSFMKVFLFKCRGQTDAVIKTEIEMTQLNAVVTTSFPPHY